MNNNKIQTKKTINLCLDFFVSCCIIHMKRIINNINNLKYIGEKNYGTY